MEFRGFERAAAEIVVAAGRTVRPWAGRAREVGTKEAPADLVTEVDRDTEALIARLVRERFPEHGLLGEEGGGTAGGEFVWHVDPIDGTTNFVHGLPGFCVSLGLCRRGEPVAGAVYDPMADVLYSASLGGGASANGVPLRVSSEPNLAGSLLSTGVPPVEPARTWALASSQAVAGLVHNIRNLGSAALHLCLVAAGRLSGFWEPALRSWDVAAAVIVLREAGGRATSLEGEDWTAATRGCMGTNGAIHDELLGVLRRVPGPRH